MYILIGSLVSLHTQYVLINGQQYNVYVCVKICIHDVTCKLSSRTVQYSQTCTKYIINTDKIPGVWYATENEKRMTEKQITKCNK